jgi:hypothetical protein
METVAAGLSCRRCKATTGVRAPPTNSCTQRVVLPVSLLM